MFGFRWRFKFNILDVFDRVTAYHDQMLTMSDEVLAWKTWLIHQQGYELHHAKTAARWAARWVEHAGEQLTPASCVSWISDMAAGTTLAPQTIRNRMSLCRQFAGWLVVQGRLSTNPWASVPAPRGRAGVGADALTQEEVDRLIQAAQRASKHPDGRVRNNADARAVLYRLLNGTGMRWGEWRYQRWDDIDLVRGEMVVTKDKSKRRDKIPLSQAVTLVLRGWRRKSKGETVFTDYPTQKGLDRDMEVCNIKGRGKWHRLRVGFITQAFELGVAPDVIQRLVRHKSIDQTHRYCRHRDSTLKAATEIISKIGKKSTRMPLDKAEQAGLDAHMFKPVQQHAENESHLGGAGLEHLGLRGGLHSLLSGESRAGGIWNPSPIDRLISSIDRLVDQIGRNYVQGRNMGGTGGGCDFGDGSASRARRADREDEADRGEAFASGCDGDPACDINPAGRCHPATRYN